MLLNRRIYFLKMWYIYIMEYYSMDDDIMKFSGKWMEPEKNLVLSEVTQTKKDKHSLYSLISGH